MTDLRTYNPDLRHPELSHAIIGAAFTVHNELGPGWDEWDYHRSMLDALQSKGLHVKSHLRENLMHRGVPADEFELDILVENRIILELKHIRSDFASEHYIQLINYLKRWEKDLGILINFGLERLGYKRVPYAPTNGEICFDGYWDDLAARLPGLTDKIILSCKNILMQHGLGYGASSSKKILLKEFAFQQMDFEIPNAAPKFNSHCFESRQLDSVLLNKKVLLSATAFDDTTATELARLRSGMKHLSISQGVLMNFGKSKITLRGVILRDSYS